MFIVIFVVALVTFGSFRRMVFAPRWLIRHPQNSKTAPTMMFFHGNAGTIAERLPNAEGLIKNVGCNVMLVEYRGYGTSQGEPTEAGLKADAQGAIDHLKQRKDIDTDNLFVFGRSLGGAVAISLAAANEGALRGVLVENTFTCIRGMAGALFPFLAVLPEPWFECVTNPSAVHKQSAVACYLRLDIDRLRVPPGRCSRTSGTRTTSSGTSKCRSCSSRGSWTRSSLTRRCSSSGIGSGDQGSSRRAPR